MGWTQAGWTLDHSPYSGVARILHFIFARLAGLDGLFSPPKARVAQIAGCVPTTVDNALARMVEDGYLAVEKQGERGRGKRTVYRFLMPDEKSNGGILLNPADTLFLEVAFISLISNYANTQNTPRSRALTVPPSGGSGLRPEASHRKPKAKGADFQPLFLALCAGCGWDVNTTPATALGRAGKAAKELLAIGVTPDMVPAAIKRYRSLFDNAALTPAALAANWPSIAPPVAVRQARRWSSKDLPGRDEIDPAELDRIFAEWDANGEWLVPGDSGHVTTHDPEIFYERNQ